MVAGVGCKDYDDDINGLKGDIEDLKGQIELKADKAAFDQLKSKVDAMDLSIYATKAELGSYVKTDQLAAKLKELNYLTKSEIEALGFQKEADVKKIFNDMLTGDAIMAKITQQVKDIAAQEFAKQNLTDAQKSQAMAAIVAAINADTETVPGIQAAIKGLLGKEFGNYMAIYISTGAFDANVDAAAAKLLDDANSELSKKINGMIDISAANVAYLKNNDLKTIFEDYDKQLEAVWAAVKELAGRIQSLVYVPTTANGQIEFAQRVIGTGGGNGEIALTETLQQVVTFRVTPASLAQTLVDAYKAGTVTMKFESEEVTRANDPAINILNAVAAENGKINLMIGTAYDFTGATDLAIALNVADVPAEDQTIPGIEFSSAYVTATSAGAANVVGNIHIATLDPETEKYVAVPQTRNLTLQYNATTALNLFGDLVLTYDVNEGAGAANLVPISEAAALMGWDYVPVLRTTNTAWTNFTTAANYKITPTNPVAATDKNKPVSVQIATGKQGVVGETATLATDFSVTIAEATAKNVVLYSGSTVVTITKALLGEVTANATYNWNYTAYDADSYAGEVAIATGKLTAAQFNGADWAGASWTVVKPANSPVIGTIAVTSAKVSTPSADSDTQIIKLTVSGYKNGTGTVSVSTIVDVDANNAIKVSGTLTFNGLPNMEYTIAVPSATYVVNGSTLDVAATTTLNTTLFTALGANQKYFTNQGQFDTFLATLTTVKDAAQAKVVATKTPAANVVASNSSKTLTVAFTAADIDFNAATSFTYTVPAATSTKIPSLTDADGYFKVLLKGGVTISKNNSYYLATGTTLYPADVEGGLPYQVASGVTVWGTPSFTIDNVLLPTGYAAKKPAGSVATVETTYSLVTTAPAGYTGTLPTVAATTGIMDWNKCALKSVTVKAVMTVDGVTLDTKTWEVRLQQPITFGWSNFSKATNEKVAINVAKEVNLFSYMFVDTSAPGATAVVKDIFGNQLVTATGVATEAANANVYGFTVTFDQPEYSSTSGAQDFTRFTFDASTGKLICGADNAPLAGVVTATVKAYFSYQYSSVLTVITPPAYANEKFMKTVTVKFENQ